MRATPENSAAKCKEALHLPRRKKGEQWPPMRARLRVRSRYPGGLFMQMNDFQEVIKIRNLYKALRKCCKGTMWKDGTAMYRWDGLENSVKLRASYLNGSYKLQRYLHFYITRPKPREITATRIRDRHGQRSACDNVLYPLLTRSFIHDNGACQVGKGVDYAINRVKCGLQRMYRKQRRERAQAAGCRVEDIGPFQPEGWVYKGDIRKYFPSSLHRVAKDTIRAKLGSPKLAAMFCGVIESFGEAWWEDMATRAGADGKAAKAFSRAVTDARTEREMLPLRPEADREAIARKCETQIRAAVAKLPGLTQEGRAQILAEALGDEARGIGLGSQISQLVQLAQLDEIDHYATEVARPEFYNRYMDDFILADTDRGKLEAAACEIEGRLTVKGLALNAKSQLIPLRSGFVFLKWHLYLTDTGKVVMRAAQGVAKEEKRRLRRMVQKVREGTATVASVRAHYEGWWAHMARGDTRRLLEQMDKYLADLLAGLDGQERKEKQ